MSLSSPCIFFLQYLTISVYDCVFSIDKSNSWISNFVLIFICSYLNCFVCILLIYLCIDLLFLLSGHIWPNAGIFLAIFCYRKLYFFTANCYFLPKNSNYLQQNVLWLLIICFQVFTKNASCSLVKCYDGSAVCVYWALKMLNKFIPA